MSGTIPLSLTQQFDEFGKPLKGGQLYLIQAGTVSTPQDGFQDPALVTKMPYPITLDAAGRIPQFFLADGFIKVRLQDSRGVVQLASESIQVIGPSASGGGGTPVDPTALVQMGNIIARYGVGVLGGYVRLNGLTIGSAVSGATERANADCQAAFNYLWITDPALVVSGGRGASAALDWAANKQITLPDWRGYGLGALDDMGNAASGRLSAAFFGSSPIVLGAVGGGESLALTMAQIPNFTPSGTIQLSIGAITINGQAMNISGLNNFGGGGGGAFAVGSAAASLTASQAASSATFTGTNVGGGQAHRTIGPRKLCTFYLKL